MPVRFPQALAVAVMAVWIGAMPLPSAAASAGLVVVIANDYDGFLPGALQDAAAVADRLEAGGFAAVRLFNAAGGAVAAGLDQVRRAAEGAGPFRIVYASGFGMCVNDDLVLFAEDMQPEQFESGEMGDVAVPLSVVAAAAAEGGGQTLVVFDTTPNQCTDAALKAITLPGKSALLVTTGVGGDLVDEVEEGGRSAFVTAFLQEFAPGRAPKDLVEGIVEKIQALTEDLQVPVLIGDL